MAGASDGEGMVAGDEMWLVVQIGKPALFSFRPHPRNATRRFGAIRGFPVGPSDPRTTAQCHITPATQESLSKTAARHDQMGGDEDEWHGPGGTKRQRL